MKFDRKHYVPILKAKAGELRAVESAGGKGTSFTPLFELCRFDQPLNASATVIQNAWSTTSPVFVDAFHVEQGASPYGDASIDTFSTAAHTTGLRIIPVTGLYRTAGQRNAVRAAAALHGLGACVRLTVEDIDDPSLLDGACGQIAVDTGITTDQLHALIDLSEVSSQFLNPMRHMVCDAIHRSDFLRMYAPTLTLAGTGFPASMTGIPANSITPIARSEWTLWNAVVGAPADRLPTFGDYAASHPSLVEFDPETMSPAAKIIYAVDLAWLAAKGRAVNGPLGYGQFRDLAQQIRSRHEFRGPTFSAGDQTIEDCATGTCGFGNLATWVTVKVSHHIAHVVDQIASLP